jgi:hypothetical protein
MSALPPKADIRFTLRHVCFVPLTRRRFIAFLKGLENEGPHTELLIVGDTFGLWELTLVEGIEKLDHIITRTKPFSINSEPPVRVSRSP